MCEKAGPSDGEFDFASQVEVAADEWGYRRVGDIADGTLALYRKEIGDELSRRTASSSALVGSCTTRRIARPTRQI